MHSLHPAIQPLEIPFGKDTSGFSCAYLLMGSRPVLIDAGPVQRGVNVLQAQLQSAGIRPETISTAYFTHGHPDHVGGAGWLSSQGIQLSISPEDADGLTNPQEAFARMFAPALETLGLSPEASEREKQGILSQFAGCFSVEHCLLEGEQIDGSEVTLQVLRTPGHTSGSISFLTDGGELLAGDAVGGFGETGGMLPLICDLPAYLATLERLKQVRPRAILTAHHYRTSGGGAARIYTGQGCTDFLDASYQIADTLWELSCRAAHKVLSFAEMSNYVLEHLPVQYGILPLEQQPAPHMTMITLAYAFRSAGTQNF